MSTVNKTQHIMYDENKNEILNYFETSADQVKMNDSNVQTTLGSLKDQVDKMLVSGAGSHNAIYRGKNLTNVYTVDQICTMISNGTFSDLFIGDYFDVSINTSLGGTETVRCVIADLDTFLLNGDTAVSKHHAVIVPKDCFKTTAKMNDTNVTTGGYVGSKMVTTTLPIYATALQTALNNHIISHRSMLTNSIATTGNSNAGAGFVGYSNNFAWTDTLLSLMSEIQLYGSTVFSSSFYDIGECNTQFNLFRHDPAKKIAGRGHGGERAWYWLSAVASASAFALCNSYGVGGNTYASDGGCVRPYFLIG